MTLPTGTVTFLRTDVEGSMRLARELGREWDVVNARHLALIRESVAANDGEIVRTEGDAAFAVFPEARAATLAAVAAQRALVAEPWPPAATVRVRMGLHTGEAHLAGDDYGGFDVNRAARVASTGHGGQVVLSETTAMLVEDALPPGTALRDLGRHVLRDVPRAEHLQQLDIAGLPTDFPPLRTGGARAGNLPDRLTSFLGRDEELAALVDLLRDARLVTLTGPGGIGKSSLAVEAARTIAPGFPDGAWFIDLAAIDDASDVLATIAHGIGIFDGPERTAADALPNYLASRSMILILDNMEHLLEAAGDVADLVRSSRDSRILVTSRAPLHIAGEREMPLSPLSDAAITIFTDRARAVRPGWEPGPDAAVVAEICALLDDLPLGIELAAARIGNLSPTVIRDRLRAGLPLPGPGARDAPNRQRTLDATVAWSYDLLEPRLQELLQNAAVFDGGFDLEELESVSSTGRGADRLDDMLELADRSLAVRVPEVEGRARFRLLRTIQGFSRGRLEARGDEDLIRRRHAEAFLGLIESLLPGYGTSRNPAILDRIEPEVDNLRSAQRWSIEAGEPELALWLAARLWRYWNALGLGDEGRRLTEAALSMPGADAITPARAWAASALGSLAYWQADSAAARTWYQTQIDLATAVDDKACIADGMFNIGHVMFIDPAEAPLRWAFMEDVEQRYRELGDQRAAARASWGRGVVLMGEGKPEAAVVYLRQAAAEAAAQDDRQYHSMSTASLGWAAFAMGDLASATHLAIEALLESHAIRDTATTTISLHIGVLAAAAAGRYEEAAEVIGAFEASCERYGVRPPAALIRFISVNDPFAATVEGLPPDVYAAAVERGRRLDLDEAVAKVAELDRA